MEYSKLHIIFQRQSLVEITYRRIKATGIVLLGNNPNVNADGSWPVNSIIQRPSHKLQSALGVTTRYYTVICAVTVDKWQGSEMEVMREKAGHPAMWLFNLTMPLKAVTYITLETRVRMEAILGHSHRRGLHVDTSAESARKTWKI